MWLKVTVWLSRAKSRKSLKNRNMQPILRDWSKFVGVKRRGCDYFRESERKNLDREDWLRLYVIKSLIFKGVLVKREQRLNSWSRKYIRRFCVIKWKLKSFWSRAFFEDPGNAFWDQYGEGFLKIYYFLKIGVTFESKIDLFLVKVPLFNIR